MAKSKILVLFDTAGTPPSDQDFTEELKTEDWETEKHVIDTLKSLGHDVKTLGVYDDISLVINTVAEDEPDVVFNLTEHFHGVAEFDRNVVGLLELLQVTYTGTGPAGLMLCKNKGTSKKILTYHHIKNPHFAVYHRGSRVHRPKKLRFPLLVKPLKEEGSAGIAQASFVENDESLSERVRFIHESLRQDAIAEEYIEGRELYVSILGNQRLEAFQIREMKFGETPEDEPKIATYKAKWDAKYRKRWGIKNIFADKLEEKIKEKISQLSRKAYRALHIRGYGRIDLRLTPKNEIFILEANPNPHLAKYEDFAESAQRAGISYEKLIQRILNLAFIRRTER